MTGRMAQGRREISLDAIVGSVGRYNDFTSTFLPRTAADAGRWAAVRAAAPDISRLPPIEVYQLGDGYFVLDGNHRVSIARRTGQQYIEAYVTEIRTRVPFAASDTTEALIVKAEYAAFLDYTKIDRLRPGADLRVTAAGQVATLENLIEVHRYVVETSEERELPFSEAVGRWHDEAYLPVVESIRELSILADFPGRTETDFYLWIVTHLIPLQRELGWELHPGSAMAALAAAFQPRRVGLRARLRARLVELWPGQRDEAEEKRTQILARERILARYGDRLFADVLVAISTADSAALAHAFVIARREEARLHALHLPAAATAEPVSEDDLETAFQNACREAGVEGLLVVEEGPPPVESDVRRLLARAPYSNLLIVERQAAAEEEFLTQSSRPVLFAGSSTALMSRLLLVAEGEQLTEPEEGAFIAAYLAERWQAPLVVALQAGQEGYADGLQRYLEMHEIEAVYEQVEEPFVEGVLKLAEREGSNLLIVSARRRGRLGRRMPNETARALVQKWTGPLLVSA
ncbi:MAG: hypothetical protein R3272_00360 [Candidatus Promineifilaceae bacterium]|nr:hypothetical protein [Candidatus Promineifilaceae bacterium]